MRTETRDRLTLGGLAAAVVIASGISGPAYAGVGDFDWRQANLAQVSTIGDCTPGTYDFRDGTAYRTTAAGHTETTISVSEANPPYFDFDGDSVPETVLKLVCVNPEAASTTEAVIAAKPAQPDQATELGTALSVRTSPMSERHITDFGPKPSNVDGRAGGQTVVSVTVATDGTTSYGWDQRQRKFVQLNG